VSVYVVLCSGKVHVSSRRTTLVDYPYQPPDRNHLTTRATLVDYPYQPPDRNHLTTRYILPASEGNLGQGR